MFYPLFARSYKRIYEIFFPIRSTGLAQFLARFRYSSVANVVRRFNSPKSSSTFYEYAVRRRNSFRSQELDLVPYILVSGQKKISHRSVRPIVKFYVTFITQTPSRVNPLDFLLPQFRSQSRRLIRRIRSYCDPYLRLSAVTKNDRGFAKICNEREARSKPLGKRFRQDVILKEISPNRPIYGNRKFGERKRR